MDLSSLLKPQAVRVLSDISSKKRLLQSIADTAEGLIGLPTCPDLRCASGTRKPRSHRGRAWRGVAARAALGADGGAWRVPAPRKTRRFRFAADRHPVDLVFALFAPTDTGVDHLKALALVSRTLRDQALCTKLGPTTIRRRSTPS
jgi:PTS system nitrogen regulatory IIA component